jgi:DNA-binding transcriptional ArsR family regulator
MVDLSHKQEHALGYPLRKQIFDWLQGRPRPASVGSVLEAVDGVRDYAAAFYHIGVLVDAELVEQEAGTNLFRVVEQ